MREKILLLGGTGAIGFYLRGELVRSGYEVVVSSRRRQISEPGVQFVIGDAKDCSFVERVIAEYAPDVIVDFMIYRTSEFNERIGFLLSKVKQYIFLSSYRVFNESVPLTERSPRLLESIKDEEYLRSDEYGLSKARCENRLRTSGRVNWTIVRPCITYSKERFQFGCLEANTLCYRALRGMPVVIPKELLSKRTTMSWAGDVAKMIARLVLNEKAYGDDFNVVSSESHTWAEIGAIYSKAIGLTVKEVTIKDYLTICGEYQLRYDRMFDRVMDNSKILAVTGLRQDEFKTLELGLHNELSQNKSGLMQIKPNIPMNARIDKMCGIAAIPHGTFADKLLYLQYRYSVVRLPIRVIRFLLRKVGKE